MSKLIVALALALSLSVSAGRESASTREAEREAVERAVRDYVEAIYQTKPELIERSVHPALEKIGKIGRAHV